MALGNQNQDNRKLYILRMRTKDADKKETSVHFQVSEKDSEGKWVSLPETVNDVSGNLTGIVLGTREHEGREYPTVKVVLTDPIRNELYWIDTSYNFLSRNLFNILFSLESFENLKIGVYQTKPRKTGEKSYAAVSVRVNDEVVKWKYKNEEMPPIERAKVGKTEVVNFDNLNEFYLEKLKELSARVAEANKGATLTPSLPPKAAVTETPISTPLTKTPANTPKGQKSKIAPPVSSEPIDDEPPF